MSKKRYWVGLLTVGLVVAFTAVLLAGTDYWSRMANPDADWPYESTLVISNSANTTLAFVTRAIYVAADGDVHGVLARMDTTVDANTIGFVGVNQGDILPLRFKYIADDTTATIVGLY